ncbi:branched-chain amino acid ABC transporter permease [Hoeflea sp. BAL378]|uniref:branched-chain amino acid ABC transporter permease n=1 Tax=Hoeflea sp. BAL378 TaxID=1547437 RepID=UPI0009DE3488|nr:branched-chain amino acid ABC transporter permease [Hoeflea sp. BAL378]
MPRIDWLGYVVLVAAMAAIYINGSGYALTIGMTIMIWSMLAIGLNVPLGLTGYYHMGIGAFFGLGAYGAGFMAVRLGQPLIVPLLVMPVIGAVISAAIGPIILRIRGLHFATATLAIGMIASDVMNNWVAVTGGPLGLAGIVRPAPMVFGPVTIDLSQNSGFYLLGCALTLALLIWFAWFRTTAFALVLRGIKSDDLQTRAFGYSTMRYKVGAFAISGAIAAAVGVYYAFFIQYISPEPFSFAASSFQAFVILAVGGIGSLWGPVLGATLITVLPEVLDLQPQVRVMTYGAILLVVIVFLPRGLASFGAYLRRAGRAPAREKVQPAPLEQPAK